jgi:hypothetical protein
VRASWPALGHWRRGRRQYSRSGERRYTNAQFTDKFLMMFELSPERAAVVPVGAPSREPLPDRVRRSRAPASSAKGRRTHSPGAASPSFVWLPIRLGNPRHIFCKQSVNCKTYRIIGLLSASWSGRLDCRIKGDAAGGPRFGAAHSRHRSQPDSVTLEWLPTGNLRLADKPFGIQDARSSGGALHIEKVRYHGPNPIVGLDGAGWITRISWDVLF